jgi:hypothetical protein
MCEYVAARVDPFSERSHAKIFREKLLIFFSERYHSDFSEIYNGYFHFIFRTAASRPLEFRASRSSWLLGSGLPGHSCVMWSLSFYVSLRTFCGVPDPAVSWSLGLRAPTYSIHSVPIIMSTSCSVDKLTLPHLASSTKCRSTACLMSSRCEAPSMYTCVVAILMCGWLVGCRHLYSSRFVDNNYLPHIIWLTHVDLRSCW